VPDYARVAYEAYAEHQQWKNYQDMPIPTWDGVRQDIKDAWGAATNAVLDAYTDPAKDIAE
jgi:pSer/pThr/pTyr-binding forkhead associated (FHA) protein